MRVETVADLGNQLPIGVLSGGKLLKNFSIRPYKGWVDRQLNLWRSVNPDKNFIDLVPKFLSLILEQMGDISFTLTDTKDSPPESIVKLYDMHYGDIMYVYLYCRIHSIDNEIELSYVCPNCLTTSTTTSDLNSTQVRVLEQPSEMRAWVTLRDGFKLESGKTCNKIELQPAKYRAQLYMGSEVTKIGTVAYNQLRDAVSGVEGEQEHYVMKDSEFDDISKRDLLMIDRQAQKLLGGPMLQTNLKCVNDKCNATITRAIDWTHDDFFDGSVPLKNLMP